MTLRLLNHRTTVVWTVLVALTVASWLLGTHGSDPRLATIIVMTVAFAKTRFVGMYFMELRHAPPALRLIFEGYCLVVGLAVVAMYLAL